VPKQDIPACQQIWSKPLSGSVKSVALLFINYASTAVAIKCDLQCLANAGISSNATVRDLWLHKGNLHQSHYHALARSQPNEKQVSL
jgi:hypothetical protein